VDDRAGEMHVISDTLPDLTVSFTSMTDRRMTEQPVDMMARQRNPQEMRFDELTRFIRASSGRGETPTCCAWSGR
jgi:hypothetical protein